MRHPVNIGSNNSIEIFKIICSTPYLTYTVYVFEMDSLPPCALKCLLGQLTKWEIIFLIYLDSKIGGYKWNGLFISVRLSGTHRTGGLKHPVLKLDRGHWLTKIMRYFPVSDTPHFYKLKDYNTPRMLVILKNTIHT